MAPLSKTLAAAAFCFAARAEEECLSLVQVNAARSSSDDSGIAVGGSLPPLLDQSSLGSLQSCGASEFVDWEGHGDSTKAFLDAWTTTGSGAIVKDSGASSCLIDGDKSSKKVMTLVSEPEAELCKTKMSPQGRRPESAEFTVTGQLAGVKSTREYQIMWPAEGTCTESTPCSVMIFFHGCAAMSLPAMQAAADDKCFSNLNTVMIIPKLEKGEKWTEQGTVALEEFVMPLWDQLKETHGAILDTNRVAAVGASLGSGMALQAALLHPEVFSLAVAAGLADGSHCEDGEGGKVEWDSSALLAGHTVPKNSWKLKGVVVVMSEKETELDSRLSSLLSIMDDNGVFDKASLNMRLYAGVGHATGIMYTFNQWSGMQEALFQGKF